LYHGTVWFHKKDWRVRLGIAPHFSHVVGIILANTKDAVDADVAIWSAGAQGRDVWRADFKYGHVVFLGLG
jgi:hypothetical protein